MIKNVPCFDSLSRVALMKYQNYFTETNFVRGSIVYREGKPLTHLHLILKGEFELQKTVHYVDPNNNSKEFDLKEFLPQTKHKYEKNQKHQRFMQSVAHFKHRAPFDSSDKLRLSLIGPYTFQGMDEITQNCPTSFVTMQCVSQSGKTLSIEREHFETILR